jgi:hypothetical protein
MTSKSLILKYLWLRGGGYYTQIGNFFFISKYSLKELNINIDNSYTKIEEKIINNQSLIKISGLVYYRDRVRLMRVLEAIVYGTAIYEIADYKITNSEKVGNGKIVDTVDIIIREIH